MRTVCLWNVGDLFDDSEEDGQQYVTDVFRRAASPRLGAILIGLRAGDVCPEIVTLGVARTLQQTATQKNRVRVDPLLRIEPLSLYAIQGLLPERLASRLASAGHPALLSALQLPPKLASATLSAIEDWVEEVGPWLESLSLSERRIDGPNGQRLAEERDAIHLALDLAGVTPPDEMLPAATSPIDESVPFGGAVDRYFVTDTEDDVIAEDLRRFDTAGELTMLSSSAARFVDGEFALTILNVNRKPIEHALGVDLVYWDETSSTFTLVQYKRLTRNQTLKQGRAEPDWTFTRRGEMEAQLGLMQLPNDNSASAQDWRLSTSPFWFKFVRTKDFTAGDPRVLRGMYVSAEFLRVALEDQSLMTGPRGGFEISYANTRYIPRDTFVDLVRRSFLGTMAAATSKVFEIIETLSDGHEVILALRTRIRRVPEKPSHGFEHENDDPV